jgi:hypothetical protein
MKDLSNDYTDTFPVSFHVFGIGEGFKPIIDKIVALGYDGVSAKTIRPELLPSPTEEDRMVIILTDEGYDSVTDAAKSFYQAGVLTLIVSHKRLESQSKFCDAQLEADTDAMYQSVKAILDMIFNNGLIALDFNDIQSSIHDAGFFKVVETTGKGGEQRVADAISKIKNIVPPKEMNAIENFIISISFNRDIQPQVNMCEMKAISDFLSNLPEEVNAIWGVFHDNKMPLDEVRLTTILSGKELRP